ncbi:peptidoglycan -binding protein [Yoonia sp. 208BN28-4]|uniref:peptidoglycan -binding protein n=1 Tax=Yoonia sp. 208BN28-4 TaxID=3126505 RepID=UPI0030A09624
MALSRRQGRFQNAIWPGFVDAMTGLLLVLMFVLTIFMVIQFVLRETITGQESQLNELSAEVASLASALGLEQDRTASLTTALDDASDAADTQSALIAQLTAERDAGLAALTQAQNSITGFEAQVAGLLAQRSTNEDRIAALLSQQAANEEVIAGLETDNADAASRIAALETREADLLTEAEALNLALAAARSEIDQGVEAARLAAAQREALEAMIADLETTGQTDAARIAALETANSENTAQITALEAQQLAEAAAAEALRERLANADTELTAMTLALEEQRRDAEETLTLLAAAETARNTLDRNLAAALLAQQQAENDLARALTEGSDLDARLLAALSLQDSTAAELADARAALDAAATQTDDLTSRLAAAISARDATGADLQAARDALDAALADSDATETEIQAQLASAILAQEAAAAELAALSQTQAQTDAERQSLADQLAEALLAQQALTAEVASLSQGQSETAQERASLEARLAEALAAMAAAQEAADSGQTEQERQAALLAQANAALSDEQALSAESQRQVALLNEQVAALRNQVGTLQTLLNLAEEADTAANVQIEQLGADLNTALARVAAEERRRRTLEEAERIRLEEEAARLAAQAQDLERFRSDFFGEIRTLLEGQDGVQIVGDRFVFSSEVLFRPGQAELSEQGRAEIANIASILRDIADDIPNGIDWVIRVDGHTDDVPLSGTGQYRDNWELSQARSLSVVQYMINFLGIPPERLAANGFGQYQPLVDDDSDAARAANRRIEIKLTER